ncbi:MAG: hypothetical protein ACRDQZ_26470, partial [Mycobacteriales bacterium]
LTEVAESHAVDFAGEPLNPPHARALIPGLLHAKQQTDRERVLNRDTLHIRGSIERERDVAGADRGPGCGAPPGGGRSCKPAAARAAAPFD